MDTLINDNSVNLINCEDIIKYLQIEHLNYIYQSDILRTYVLIKYGGIWSDFDIIYIDNYLESYYRSSAGKILTSADFICRFAYSDSGAVEIISESQIDPDPSLT